VANLLTRPAAALLGAALLISDTEAARLCGVSRATWHRLRAAGKIGPQPIRLGRAVRYLRSDVEKWAASGCPDSATWRAMQATEGRRSARVV
jgi:predicted DNA-binding transcriptional regulator AlpA